MPAPKKYVLTSLTRLGFACYAAGGLLCGLVAYFVTDNAMLQQNRMHLEAVLTSRATLVENQFEGMQEQVRHLAETDLILAATAAFTEGFAGLPIDLQLPVEQLESLEEELTAFYEVECAQVGGAMSASDLMPATEAGRLAQLVYLARNPNAPDARRTLHESPFASGYETAHRRFHPKLERFLRALNFRDIFLVDSQANLVYSTQKEVDFATNLIRGPFASTGLGRACRGALSAPPAMTEVADFECYAPSKFEAAAFLACPVFDQGKRIGAVAFQVAVGELNAMVSDLRGLGNSGEVYIVGGDGLMRTDSRFASSSTVVTQRVGTRAAKRGLAGHSGFEIASDYRGIDVLSQYRPLQIDGLDWAMLAEVDRSDVRAPAIRLTLTLAAIFVVVLLVIAGASVMTLRACIIRPLRQLLAGATEIGRGNYASRVHVASEDEFAVLATSHNDMAAAVEEHVGHLETALAEVHELQGLLPICSGCKSIRDDDGYFRTVETYLVGKSKVQFSHTVCTECVPRLYPELKDSL